MRNHWRFFKTRTDWNHGTVYHHKNMEIPHGPHGNVYLPELCKDVRKRVSEKLKDVPMVSFTCDYLQSIVKFNRALLTKLPANSACVTCDFICLLHAILCASVIYILFPSITVVSFYMWTLVYDQFVAELDGLHNLFLKIFFLWSCWCTIIYFNNKSQLMHFVLQR